jgi:hypothetical protein
MPPEARLSAEAAGYMELAGAKKNADCHKVAVAGGVSRELGCCNKFEPEDADVQRFHCGECAYVKSKGFASRIGAK